MHENVGSVCPETILLVLGFPNKKVLRSLQDDVYFRISEIIG